MVAIVGRPNVGKSTLINSIMGEKISIVSDVPQTTRKMLRGIYTDERGQVIFIDTPGWHIGRDHLDRYMNQACVNAIEGVDCIIYTVDSSERVGEEPAPVAESAAEPVNNHVREGRLELGAQTSVKGGAHAGRKAVVHVKTRARRSGRGSDDEGRGAASQHGGHGH